jgi:hypothetical protein
MNLLSAISLLAEIGRYSSFRDEQAVGRLFRVSNERPAIERNNSTRAYYQSRQKTSADGGNPGGSFNGQSNEHAADELLRSKETRKRLWQSDLCDGEKIVNDNFCDVEKGVGLLVSGRPLV